MLNFKNYKNFGLNNKILLKSWQRFKSEVQNVFTEEIKTIALSCNGDKELHTFDRIISYPYGPSVGKYKVK